MPAVGAGGGGFGGLSCPTPILCVAVGATAAGQAGWTTAAEGGGAWDWSPFRTLPPVSVTPDFLQAVSCPTPTRCVAVGYAQDGTGPNSWYSGFAITTSGNLVGRSWRWSVPVELPPGSTGVDRLMGVSCPTATQCVAVGLNVAEHGIVAAARWTGNRWTWSSPSIAPPDPTGLDELLSVSCPSASTCVAVGDDGARNGDTPYGVTTIGTRVGAAWTWSTESTVAPVGTSLKSVSCPTATHCVAVGVNVTLGSFDVVGGDASGSWSWSGPTPFLAAAGGSPAPFTAKSVSCTPKECVAVGTDASADPAYADAPGPTGNWSPVHAVAYGSLVQPGPDAVSCPRSDDCVQVGVTTGGTNTWTATVAPPQPARAVRALPGNDRATVIWAPPAFDGGARVGSYRVLSVPGRHTCAIGVRRARPNRCTVVGLTNGTRYRFVVKADNGIGVSRPSRSSRPVIPSPFQPPVSSPFTSAFRQQFAAQPGVVTAAVYDVLTGQTWTINPGSVQHTASIVKVDILAALLYGEQRDHVQMPASIRSLATLMIEDSDNAAASALYAVDGQAPGLTAFNKVVGLTGTTPNYAWGFTDTTALDQTRLVRLFAVANPVLDTASRQLGLYLMRHVTPYQAWGISAGPPAKLAVAIKNGWLPQTGGWQINSIGWVAGDRRSYVVAFLTNQDATMGTGVSSIEALSQVIWRNLAPVEHVRRTRRAEDR